MAQRNRTIGSIKNELLEKSKEAALCAVQIFNNPSITFKSESFVVLMIIAWTYLLHAYYREKGIEYRYYDQPGKNRRYRKTKNGSDKYWDLSQCLEDASGPLDNETKKNLLFLIGLRHEIEHQMTSRIDDFIGAKLQACCLNYNTILNKIFKRNIAHYQPLSLQFFAFGEEQIRSLKEKPNIPKNIIDFIASYEGSLTVSERSSPLYSYKVIYLRDNVSDENLADKAVRFVSDNSSEGKEIHNVLMKHKQYKKLTQNQVVEKIKLLGFKNFTAYEHQLFWKSKWKNAQERNAKATKQYGELVINSQWLWYEETWLPLVEEHCNNKKSKYQ